MSETLQTQDADGGTPDGMAQLGELDRLAGSDGGEGFEFDPGIAGLDTLPQTDSQKVRDAILSKHNELEREKQAARDERAQWARALEVLQRSRQEPTTPQREQSPEERFAGLTPYQVIEKLADERAERKFEELTAKMGLPKVKENTDTIMRELQILAAKTVHPNIMQHEAEITQLHRSFKPQTQEELSVLDLMSIYKGRQELARAQNGQRQNGQRPQQPRSQAPTAAVSRPGFSAAGTAENMKTKDLADAFQKAKAMHGITGEYRLPVNR